MQSWEQSIKEEILAVNPGLGLMLDDEHGVDAGVSYHLRNWAGKNPRVSSSAKGLQDC
jgi:hypothetical protein